MMGDLSRSGCPFGKRIGHPAFHSGKRPTDGLPRQVIGRINGANFGKNTRKRPARIRAGREKYRQGVRRA